MEISGYTLIVLPVSFSTLKAQMTFSTVSSSAAASLDKQNIHQHGKNFLPVSNLSLEKSSWLRKAPINNSIKTSLLRVFFVAIFTSCDPLIEKRIFMDQNNHNRSNLISTGISHFAQSVSELVLKDTIEVEEKSKNL